MFVAIVIQWIMVLFTEIWNLTGVIKTALPNMDREAKDQYLLVIQAKDMVGQNGGLSGTTSVTVTLTDVNDNPPRFPRSKLFNEMTNFKNIFTVFTFFQILYFLFIFLSYIISKHSFTFLLPSQSLLCHLHSLPDLFLLSPVKKGSSS